MAPPMVPPSAFTRVEPSYARTPIDSAKVASGRSSAVKPAPRMQRPGVLLAATEQVLRPKRASFNVPFLASTAAAAVGAPMAGSRDASYTLLQPSTRGSSSSARTAEFRELVRVKTQLGVLDRVCRSAQNGAPLLPHGAVRQSVKEPGAGTEDAGVPVIQLQGGSTLRCNAAGKPMYQEMHRLRCELLRQPLRDVQGRLEVSPSSQFDARQLHRELLELYRASKAAAAHSTGLRELLRPAAVKAQAINAGGAVAAGGAVLEEGPIPAPPALSLAGDAQAEEAVEPTLQLQFDTPHTELTGGAGLPR